MTRKKVGIALLASTLTLGSFAQELFNVEIEPITVTDAPA